MNLGKILEYTGTALLVLSLIGLLASRVESLSFLHWIQEEQQLFFWGGLLLWSLGVLIKKQPTKES